MNNRNKQNAKQTNSATQPQAPISYLAKSVAVAYTTGLVECNNEHHHYLKRVDGSQHPIVVVKNSGAILQLMSVGKEAVCECERSACQWAWKSQDRFGLTSDNFVQYGKFYKGVDAGKYDNRRVIQPTYVVKNTAFLKQSFPNVLVVVSPWATPHDHAISHTVTEYVRRLMYDTLPVGTAKTPKRYLDLHGSPGVNLSYNRSNVGIVIESLVEIVTAKDNHRAKKWPSHPTVFRSFNAVKDRLRSFDGFISSHSSYYYDDEFYNRIGIICPDATFHFLAHRFEYNSGEFNNGELSYTKYMKEGVRMVQQKNAYGSDSYCHPDNSFWFESNSRSLPDTAMTWSTNQVCDGTWVITGCFCKKVFVQPPVVVAKADAKATSSFVNAGRVTLFVKGKDLSCPIRPGHQAEFFDELRIWISGKSRSHKKFDDFQSRYKGLNGTGLRGKYKIEGRVADRLARAAFYVDCAEQAVLLPLLFHLTAEDTKALENMVPTDRENNFMEIVTLFLVSYRWLFFLPRRVDQKFDTVLAEAHVDLPEFEELG